MFLLGNELVLALLGFLFEGVFVGTGFDVLPVGVKVFDDRGFEVPGFDSAKVVEDFGTTTALLQRLVFEFLVVLFKCLTGVYLDLVVVFKRH